MELKDSFKESGLSFDKVNDPEDTIDWAIKRLESLSRPVLKGIKRIDKGRLGIPVYISEYDTNGALVTGTKKQMGKGVTKAQAKASALMELVERFSLFEFIKRQEFEVRSYSETPDFKLPIEHQLKAIHVKNIKTEERNFLETFPHKWTEGLYVTENRKANIPLSWHWPINEYNGSAAGNSLEEATVQAICEVVERHVSSVISYERLRTPTIDLESIKDKELNELIQKFKDLGCKVVLKDFSLDTGIPTVGAIAWDPSTYPERSEIVYTAGTSTSPVRAAIRALTEVAQLAGDFDTDGKYLESGLPKFATLEEAEYVLDSKNVIPLSDLPDCSSKNFKEEIFALSKRLRDAGMPLYLIDITHEELGIPAVYAIIPGNHFRDRTINLELPFHLAKLISTQGILEPIQAMVHLLALNDLYPNRYDINFYLGHISTELGDHEGAIGFFNRALELNPPQRELPSIYCNLGNSLRIAGRIDEAIKNLKRARELDDSLKEIHNLLGNCLYQKGKYLEAIECFEKAISIDPNSAIDYANIGSNLRKLGLFPVAKKWYQMALELDPTIDWARKHLEEISNIQ